MTEVRDGRTRKLYVRHGNSSIPVKILSKVGRGGRVGRAQVSKSRGPGFNPTDAVSNLGQVCLP